MGTLSGQVLMEQDCEMWEQLKWVLGLGDKATTSPGPIMVGSWSEMDGEA